MKIYVSYRNRKNGIDLVFFSLHQDYMYLINKTIYLTTALMNSTGEKVHHCCHHFVFQKGSPETRPASTRVRGLCWEVFLWRGVEDYC